MSCYCKCSVTVPHGAMGWSALCNIDIFLSYSLTFLYTGKKPGGYKTVFCSIQMSMKFILLINVKMPIIVGNLTFIGRIKTTSEFLKQENIFFLNILAFNSSLNIMLSLVGNEKCS